MKKTNKIIIEIRKNINKILCVSFLLITFVVYILIEYKIPNLR